VHRRTFLTETLASAVALLAAAAGWIAPRSAAAAEWPRDAYAAKTVEDALRQLYGSMAVIPSTEVKIRAPFQAENGSVVPVSISTNLPDVQSISVLVEKNPAPLAAHINLGANAVPYFSANIKMAATSDMHFVVKSGGKLYGAKQNIKVTVGGCGG
jgi:sulfur-oxidizing protein SoxY